MKLQILNTKLQMLKSPSKLRVQQEFTSSGSMCGENVGQYSDLMLSDEHLIYTSVMTVDQ